MSSIFNRSEQKDYKVEPIAPPPRPHLEQDPDKLKAPGRAELENFAAQGWLDKANIFAYERGGESGWVFYTTDVLKDKMAAELRAAGYNDIHIVAISENEYAIYIANPAVRARREGENWFRMRERRVSTEAVAASSLDHPAANAGPERLAGPGSQDLSDVEPPPARPASETQKTVIEKIGPENFLRLTINRFNSSRDPGFDEVDLEQAFFTARAYIEQKQN